MTYGFITGAVLRGLAFRVLFFLSLALLPIGLIAIVQTQQITQQTQTNAELSLLAVTEQATFAETEILQQAFGASETLGPVVKLMRNDPVACSRFLRAYKDASITYSLVGFIDSTGMMTCSSSDAPFDFSEDPEFIAMAENPQRRATSTGSGSVSRRPVTVVSTPIFSEREFIGAVFISIPFTAFDDLSKPQLPRSPVAIITFNERGEVLTSDHALDINEAEVPPNIALSLFTGDNRTVFLAENKNGLQRAYAIQPIVRDAAYAMTVWPADTPFLDTALSSRASALLPIVMWAASLVVAFWALNRLAIRHIRKLGRQMRRFALNRKLPEETLGYGVPTELVDMESAFIAMGESLLRDEATLEDSLREKNILLKEVHHRVKNNLQLISSIMNMQIRQAKTEDARFVLRRLQDRILSLATVHKNLYQNDDLQRVDASVLLHEVVSQLLSVGLAPGSNVEVFQEYAEVNLDADDAAPLTLLVSEALTNALKYLPKDRKAKKQLTIRLISSAPDKAELEIINTVGGAPEEEGTGLGSKLILAFARQLNGQTEVCENGDLYRLSIAFPVPQQSKQVLDY
ncbi:sensor histidine kinase [Sulfitobacter sp. JB4-11]|uniref:sensor histidine kinase n=1 Tax=Sulfitobacter rhodophyticola TaxID=3238304 RepID=UPI003D81272D